MGLIASYLLALQPLEPGAIVTGNTGVMARALLYGLLGQADPALWVECHESDGPKPFTCSMLMGRLAKDHAGQLRLGEGPYRLRFTALTEAVADALSTTLYRVYATGTEVTLGSSRFRLRRVITASEEQFWARASTHETLLGTPPSTRWRLCFHSPTTFNQQRGHMPLPVPVSIFRSALATWNAPWSKAPPLRDDLLQFVNESVFLDRVDIRTRPFPLEGTTAAGFIGRADLRAMTELPGDVLTQMNALAEYLYFSGVGHGTPRGCGQVAVLPMARRVG